MEKSEMIRQLKNTVLKNITKSNVSEYFNAYYNEWLFMESESVKLENQTLTLDDRQAILTDPKNEFKLDFEKIFEIEPKTSYGLTLTKQVFAKRELEILEPLSYDIKLFDAKTEFQYNTYIDYLKDVNKKHFDIKHKFPTIDKNLFNPDWIFDTYVNNIFKGSKECFDAWLVDGIEHPEQLEWLLSKREGKPNFAQLRLFINTITNSDTAKKAYYKKVFGYTVETSDRAATYFDDELKELRLKKDANKLKIKK